MAGSILPLGLDRPLYWICFTIILAIVISGILFFEIFGQSHYSDISWSSVHGDYIVAVLALFSAIVSIIIAFSNGNSLNTAFVPPHALLPFTYFLAYMLGRSLVVGRSAARRFMLGSHIGLIVIMAISLLAHGLDLGIADLGWDTWSDTYSGTLSNPNHMNLIAAICLAFCCNELLTIIGSSKSNKSPFRADARFLLVILGLTVSIVGIVATESRLFVAYLVPMLASRVWMSLGVWRPSLLVLLSGAVGCLCYLVIILSADMSQAMGLETRRIAALAAIDHIDQLPFFGIGFGYIELEMYTVVPLELAERLWSSTHNSYLDYLMFVGLIPFVLVISSAFIWFIYNTLNCENAWLASSGTCRFAYSSLFGIFFVSLFDYAVLVPAIFLFVIGYVVVLSNAVSHRHRHTNS